MSSENPSGADNQQETARTLLELDPFWVSGFVDGEGCFSVSIHRNLMAPWGWQINPVFHVYQHERHRVVLEALHETFGAGVVRSKGPQSSVLTFAIHGVAVLRQQVVPFFERYPLVVKQDDFRIFSDIVEALERKEHREWTGFERCVRNAYAMNALGKQRKRPIAVILEGSSETAREASSTVIRQTTKIQSDLHGDMQSQAEMTWPCAVKSAGNNHA